MRSVGLITEYNPFHNGHLHHLCASVATTDAEVSVAVMSGHFLQRGEPALVDKWVRTKMALAAGVDLIVELPLPWACSSAPDFARGAVQALNTLGGIDSLCFGSETGDLKELADCVDLLGNHQRQIAAATAKLLRAGQNYPAARAQVIGRLMPQGAETLSTPNNILGIEYLRALQQTASFIKPATIQRRGSGFHDMHIDETGIASATGIRARLAAGKAVAHLIPSDVQPLLHRALEAGGIFIEDKYFTLLLARIFSEAQDLNRFWLVENGIENRLLAAAEEAQDLDDLINRTKSRQLTRTRIQRMLVAIFLGMEQETTRSLLAAEPRYLHLLGASRRGMTFLASQRKKRLVPLIQNFSGIYPRLKRFHGSGSQSYQQAEAQLNLELCATRLYRLLMGSWSERSRNLDFFTPLLTKD